MDKKLFMIEIIKGSFLLLIFISLIFLYLKLNAIEDSLESITITSSVENRIEEEYSSALHKSVIRSAMWSEIINITAMAQQYNRRPKRIGGGENSFFGFQIPKALEKSESAFYEIHTNYSDSLKIRGIGKEIGADGKNPIEIELTVTPNSFGKIIIIN